jgi:hypothetical protein
MFGVQRAVRHGSWGDVEIAPNFCRLLALHLPKIPSVQVKLYCEPPRIRW